MTKNIISKFVTAGILSAGLVACAPAQETKTASKEVAPMTMNMHNVGVVTIPSKHSVDVTIDRMEKMVKAKGLRVFIPINHYQNAKDMGLEMRPNTLLIFGSPKIGAPIMSESPTIGLDVPVKALAWQDKDGNVFLSYNDPAYLKDRHGIKTATAPLDKMAKALAGLTAKAAAE